MIHRGMNLNLFFSQFIHADFFSFSGGPGSRKGKLLDDVSHVYGLKLISTETVLMEELSKKLENPNSSKRTEDIAALLKVQLHKNC